MPAHSLGPRLCVGVLALAVVMILTLFAGSLHAAPEEDAHPPAPAVPKSPLDVRIPIPFSPDVQNNGCHARRFPSEQSGDDLTAIPFWRLIEHAAGRYAVHLTADGPEKFAARIAPLDEDMRRLVLLYTLWDSMAWKDPGVQLFFEDKAGAIAPVVRDALEGAGLARESSAFSGAMALFGENYPLESGARKKFFATGTPSPRLNQFDRRMLALSAQFGTRDSFSKSIVGYVERTPILWRRIEALRENLSEPDRLESLTHTLQAKIDLWKPDADIEHQLAAFSKPQRTLFAIAAFNDEFKDGGVHQFFYNSSGAIAPDVYDAMIELGLPQQADIFKRGLDMFSKPYIRETQRRRETDFKGEWNDWDKRLSGLTDEFYALDGGLEFHAIGGGMTVEGGPGIDHAILKYARQHRLLPC
jgi:Domain of unknown function (DUF4375)